MSIDVLIVRAPQPTEEPSSYRITAYYAMFATVLENNSIKSRFLNADFIGQARNRQLHSLKYTKSKGRYWRDLLHKDHPKWKRLREVLKKKKPAIVLLYPQKFHNVHPAIIASKICNETLSESTVVAYSKFKQSTDLFLAEESIDFVIKKNGDLEPVLLQLSQRLLEGKEVNQVPNLAYRKDGELVHTEEKCILLDYNKLPIPNKDFVLDKESYPPSAFGSIAAGRGCVWGSKGKCRFCVGRYPLRLRDPEQVVGDIKITAKKHKTREFEIIMTSLTADRDWAERFCKLLIEEDLKVVWNCYVNAVEIDDEIARLMRKAGGYNISIGFESGSERTLKRMKKPYSLKKYKEAAEAIKRNGMTLWGSFIVGYPGERPEDIKQTLKLISDIKPDVAILQNFIPRPQLPLTDELKEKGLVKDERFWEYGRSTQKLKLKNIDQDKLTKIWDKYQQIANHKERLAKLDSLKREDVVKAKLREYSYFLSKRPKNALGGLMRFLQGFYYTK